LKLVELKENSDASETGNKIRSILLPMEYTRLDRMVDVLFATAKDVEADLPEEVVPDKIDEQAGPDDKKRGIWQFTERAALDDKRDEAIATMADRLAVPLLRKSRALFWDASHEARVVSVLSKHYDRAGYDYWYAFHPSWKEFLEAGEKSFVVFGCMDKSFVFVIPWPKLEQLLPFLTTTTVKEGNTYWHVHLAETPGRGFTMRLPKGSGPMSVDEYRVPLKTA
jgi:hypothetical protein